MESQTTATVAPRNRRQKWTNDCVSWTIRRTEQVTRTPARIRRTADSNKRGSIFQAGLGISIDCLIENEIDGTRSTLYPGRLSCA